MALNNVSLVYSYFADPEKSQAISEGDVYVGIPDLDANDIPQNQKQVYHRQEDGSDVPVTQPLQTGAGGVILVNGSPAQIVVDGNYSMVVLDKSGAQKYYDANRYNGEPVTTDTLPSVGLGSVDTIADLRDYDVSGLSGNELLYVSGYYAPGDVEIPAYFWDAASTDTDDGGVTILPTGHTGPGIWKSTDQQQVSAKRYGSKGDGATDDTATLQLAIDFGNTNNVPVYIEAGTYLVSNALTITRQSQDQTGFNMFGAGRTATTLKYTGSTTIDGLIVVNITAVFSINNRFENFAVDMTGAPTGVNGIVFNPGVWRSVVQNVRIFKTSPASNTGYAISLGSATVSLEGSYDNKLENMYISGFERGVSGLGSDLSGNTLTNLSINNSYISSCDYCVYVSFYNGVFISGSQLELAVTAGLYAEEGYTVVLMGGTVESPVSGAKGIVAGTNARSIIALTDMLNNDGGQFESNGQIGHFYKTANSGLVLAEGSEFRVDSDGTNFGKIRFLEDGVADIRLRVAEESNAFAAVDSTDVELFKFARAGGGEPFFDVLTNGVVRFITDGEIQHLNSGVTIRWLTGNGSPEGVVTAPVGSFYLRRDGGTGTTFYVKETGGGNTGWVAK